MGYTKIERIPADEIFHVYVQDQPSQLRGISWLSPLILTLKHVGDVQEYETLAALISSCVALFIKQETPIGPIGVNAENDEDDEENTENELTRIQPGMIARLGKNEEIQSFAPNRPNSDMPGFLTHLLMTASTGLPMVKASQVTNDFQRATFSAERAAELNIADDTARYRDWLTGSLCKPVWSKMVDAGILVDYFAGLDIDQPNIHDSFWRGPGLRQVNPVQEQMAIAASITNLTSSFSIESAKAGYDTKDLLGDIANTVKEARELGLPEEFIGKLLGVNVSATTSKAVDPSVKQDEETLLSE